MERLKHRTDFRAAAAATRAPGKAFVLLARRRADQGAVRVGYTVSRQVGNAVERNRARRRLRELMRLASAGSLHCGHDYVLVGRRAALNSPFGDMAKELVAALTRVHTAELQGTGGAGKPPLHEAGAPNFTPPKPRRNPEPQGPPRSADAEH